MPTEQKRSVDLGGLCAPHGLAATLRQAGTSDLGPFAALVEPGQTFFFKQQSTKKLYGTKTNCVHAQLEHTNDKIQKAKI